MRFPHVENSLIDAIVAIHDMFASNAVIEKPDSPITYLIANAKHIRNMVEAFEKCVTLEMC